jgi:prevent-host-death family protein
MFLGNQGRRSETAATVNQTSPLPGGTLVETGLKEPMPTIVAFDAKTHHSTVLDRVARGERITITRHGVPAAMLVPVDDQGPKVTPEEIVEGMGALRQSVQPDTMSVREMIKVGRRF